MGPSRLPDHTHVVSLQVVPLFYIVEKGKICITRWSSFAEGVVQAL